MPYKSKLDRAAAQRRYRARRADERLTAAKSKRTASRDEAGAWPLDPAGAVARWSRDVLKVPPGHPRSGEPMELPDYGVSFLADVFTHRESLLCVARKNSKSGIVAVLLLACMAGPLRRPGFAAGVASISKDKAALLKRQCEQIAEASNLQGLQFLKSPAPGRIEAEGIGGIVEIMSAETGGNASSFDLSICDELGLFKERDREFVASMRSAISAKNGRFVSLSVHGDGPFIPEILERRGDQSLAVALYQAHEGCALDDEDAWAAANPGIACGIKSLDYMRDESRRVSVTTTDQAHFRAFDLNQPGSPTLENLVSVRDWESCMIDELPERRGKCVIGFDAGASSSMTCSAVYWPESGRFEVYAGLPDTPDIAAREAVDRAPYALMVKRGELDLYAGRLVPVGRFVEDLAERLRGEHVLALGADRFRKAEVLQALEAAKVDWPVMWRGTGASATADGSHDVRAFQRAVIGKRIRHSGSVLMASAIKGSRLRVDVAGNPALEKIKSKSRIDAAQASVISAGLAEVLAVEINRPKPRMRMAVVDA